MCRIHDRFLLSNARRLVIYCDHRHLLCVIVLRLQIRAASVAAGKEKTGFTASFKIKAANALGAILLQKKYDRIKAAVQNRLSDFFGDNLYDGLQKKLLSTVIKGFSKH